LVPFLPRSVGFLPVFSPPEPGLAQHRVGRLPFPIDSAELVALGDELGPDPLEHPAGGPPLEPVVDGALGPETPGQLVPLAAAPHPEDDRVDHHPPVGDLAAGRLHGPEVQEDRLDPAPEVVGDFPDRTKGLTAGLRAGHGGGSCSVNPEDVYLTISSFVQKAFRRFSDSYLNDPAGVPRFSKSRVVKPVVAELKAVLFV